jgi:hypothetical protein
MYRFLLVLLLPCVLAACAAAPSSPTAEGPREEKEYRVGSRIPVRDPVAASPTTQVDPAALRSLPPATRAN